jgi:hypothetical protein
VTILVLRVRGMYSGENPQWGKPEHSTDWRRFDVLGCARLCTVATPTSRECVWCWLVSYRDTVTYLSSTYTRYLCPRFCVVGQAAYTWPVISARRPDGKPRGMHLHLSWTPTMDDSVPFDTARTPRARKAGGFKRPS